MDYISRDEAIDKIAKNIDLERSKAVLYKAGAALSIGADIIYSVASNLPSKDDLVSALYVSLPLFAGAALYKLGSNVKERADKKLNEYYDLYSEHPQGFLDRYLDKDYVVLDDKITEMDAPLQNYVPEPKEYNEVFDGDRETA